MKVGDQVKFRDPQTAAEATERFIILELNGDRMLVRYICNLPIQPTSVYLTEWMVESEAEKGV